jgi:transcriptional antiterminator NusG
MDEKPPLNAYCLMCRTGNETHVISLIRRYAPELTAVAPIRILPEKMAGQWRNREKALLPGYIFLFSDQDYHPNIRRMSRHFFKYLSYEIGSRQLYGNDKIYAEWIYKYKGGVAPSNIYSEGDQIRVIDGPIADSLGTIIKLDKHKRRAWVNFDFEGQLRTVCLGVQFIDPLDSIVSDIITETSHRIINSAM